MTYANKLWVLKNLMHYTAKLTATTQGLFTLKLTRIGQSCKQIFNSNTIEWYMYFDIESAHQDHLIKLLS